MAESFLLENYKKTEAPTWVKSYNLDPFTTNEQGSMRLVFVVQVMLNDTALYSFIRKR